MSGGAYNATVDLLERNLQRPERPYLLTASRSFSYGEIIDAAARFGAGLLARGLHAGDRVLLAAQDSPEFVIAFWGTIRAGLAAVPVAPILSAAEIELIARDSGARLIVFDASVEKALSATSLPELTMVTMGATGIAGALAWDVVSDDPARLSAVSTREDDIALWLYTSGTTGTPKAALHRHAGLRATPEGMARQIAGMTADDVVLSASRMFFTWGLITSVLSPAPFGAQVVVHGGPVFPLSFQGLVERFSPTLLFGSGSFFAGYAGLEQARRVPSLRLAISSGDPVTPSTFEGFAERIGVPILDGLGCTEAMHVTSNRADDAVAGCAGRALEGYDVEVRDEQGRRVPDGDSGSLWLRGPTVFAGYWNRPELTQRCLIDGWLRTGDAVHLTDGRLYHDGRYDDLLKVGGLWVAPLEVEEALRTHADVREAGVVALSGDRGATAIKAFVVSSRTDDGFARELAAHCASHLPAFKVPRFFEVVSALPRTASGKLKRAELRRTGHAQ